MQVNSSVQGDVGLSDQNNPCTPHTTPFVSTEQLITRSMTLPWPAEGAADADWPTTDVAEEGVDAGLDTNIDVEAAFPRSSHVTSTSSIVTTFLVNDEIVPINIEKIPGDYKLFNLVFIIFF